MLSLHYFLILQFQIFTNLLFGIFGVSYFFYWDFWNYVSVIVILLVIILLQCYLLWIFASRRRLQVIVCIEVSTPLHLKNITPSFAKSPLKSSNYPSPPFQAIHPPSKKELKNTVLKIQIFLWTPIILKFFIINLIPSFKSN